MNAFMREHARPLVGSVLLHALLASVAVGIAWFSVAPKIVQPPAMQAYLVPATRSRAGAVVQPLPASPPAPAPAPEAVPERVATPAPEKPKAPDPAVLVRERRAAEVAATAEARRVAAALEARTEAAKRKATERDAKRKAAVEAKQAADQKRKAQVEEQRLHAAAVEEKRRIDAEARSRAQREADLARQLADEQTRLGAQNAGLQARYVADIRARIERAWLRPPTARPGIRCTVDVSQVPGGTVTDVRVGDCNGDAAVVESIKNAVFRASPLPVPADPSLFERKLHLVFNPDG
jgi:colicin import membrane protein